MFTTFAVFYAKTRLILPVALAHQLSNLHVTWDYALGRLMSP
jgi:hypothetical protein